MQRKYFVYLHDRDHYDLHLFNEVLRSVSKYFMIDFEEAEAVLNFLKSIEDGLYPQRIIIDLYESQQVKAFIEQLRMQEQLPLLPILVLRDRSEDLSGYSDVAVFRRPKNRSGWEALVQQLIE